MSLMQEIQPALPNIAKLWSLGKKCPEIADYIAEHDGVALDDIEMQRLTRELVNIGQLPPRYRLPKPNRQKLAASKTVRVYEQWEDDIILEMIEAGHHRWEIANRLERTTNSIIGRSHRIRYAMEREKRASSR